MNEKYQNYERVDLNHKKTMGQVKNHRENMVLVSKKKTKIHSQKQILDTESIDQLKNKQENEEVEEDDKKEVEEKEEESEIDEEEQEEEEYSKDEEEKEEETNSEEEEEKEETNSEEEEGEEKEEEDEEEEDEEGEDEEEEDEDDSDDSKEEDNEEDEEEEEETNSEEEEEEDEEEEDDEDEDDEEEKDEEDEDEEKEEEEEENKDIDWEELNFQTKKSWGEDLNISELFDFEPKKVRSYFNKFLGNNPELKKYLRSLIKAYLISEQLSVNILGKLNLLIPPNLKIFGGSNTEQVERMLEGQYLLQQSKRNRLLKPKQKSKKKAKPVIFSHNNEGLDTPFQRDFDPLESKNQINQPINEPSSSNEISQIDGEFSYLQNNPEIIRKRNFEIEKGSENNKNKKIKK
ncbi:hypothetical protein M0812_19369 [Anaeramoeba flamelloides]|uniref:Uncharacterized protein n=1 Tax=Anaeramoeba flamelloides TaxID=1746091 RepID=A0AAV7Z0P3_9EUKA|nr:hypothetical protein M0812_19369 [Anaeramoeba flamelloides]